MEFNAELLMVPVVLFLTIVMPIWLIFHYITIWKRERRQRLTDKTSYRDLQELAERLEDRLEAIESILDTDAPEWRTTK